MRHVIIMMYDAPSDEPFETWMHGPHYDEVLATPGVVAVQRYEVVSGPDDRRQYVALIHTDNVEATMAWRDSPAGQKSQQEANARGVANRYGLIGRCIFDESSE